MVMDLPGVAPAEAGFTPGFNSAAPPALLGWEDEERPEEVMPPTSFSPAHQPPLFPFLLLGPRIAALCLSGCRPRAGGVSHPLAGRLALPSFGEPFGTF